mmetsp:Transcript_8738/g.35696  ORF Transcript_8738/g.35696 Transcript_8738/m.35696 type:complete len:314 (+) Transcript_8738:732-1673(+)
MEMALVVLAVDVNLLDRVFVDHWTHDCPYSAEEQWRVDHVQIAEQLGVVGLVDLGDRTDEIAHLAAEGCQVHTLEVNNRHGLDGLVVPALLLRLEALQVREVVLQERLVFKNVIRDETLDGRHLGELLEVEEANALDIYWAPKLVLSQVERRVRRAHGVLLREVLVEPLEDGVCPVLTAPARVIAEHARRPVHVPVARSQESPQRVPQRMGVPFGRVGSEGATLDDLDAKCFDVLGLPQLHARARALLARLRLPEHGARGDLGQALRLLLARHVQAVGARLLVDREQPARSRRRCDGARHGAARRADGACEGA